MAERHEELVELLQAVNRGIYEQIKDVLAKHGLPSASMVVMHHVHKEQGITISELSRRTGLAKSHVSKTIDSLTEQGFIEKRPDPADHRLVRLHTTEQADQHFGQMQGDLRARLSGVVAALPDDKVDAVIQALQVLRGVLAEERRS
jgi:DNA-binding MarR family transcriptional regulator